MSITRFETNDRMSRAVIHNNTLYLCGQVAADAETNISTQTQTMLDKVETLLNNYESSKEHILSATIYLKSMSDFHAMNAIWEAWIPTGFAPVRACVSASMAREELLVEISVVAATKQ
ncbi:MAG: RidA family protein [Gammaproteobacteria bacterium]|nr:RidA family protein [Gammaproteobacteria bacterium]